MEDIKQINWRPFPFIKKERKSHYLVIRLCSAVAMMQRSINRNYFHLNREKRNGAKEWWGLAEFNTIQSFIPEGKSIKWWDALIGLTFRWQLRRRKEGMNWCGSWVLTGTSLMGQWTFQAQKMAVWIKRRVKLRGAGEYCVRLGPVTH